MKESTVKYKEATDRKRRLLELNVGDYVWVVLTKDRFPVHEYTKLEARKIGPYKIIEKINSNAYRLNLPSHIHTTPVFNVKHLIPFCGDNSEEDDEIANSRSNSFQPGEDDADSIAEDYPETRGRRYGHAVGKTAITWAA